MKGNKHLFPFKTFLKDKKIIFSWDKLSSTRIGHLYDVITGLEVSLYIVKNTHLDDFRKGIEIIEWQHLYDLRDADKLITVFENKHLSIDTSNIDLIKFKGYLEVTDEDIFNMVKKQLEVYLQEDDYLIF